jgi:Globin
LSTWEQAKQRNSNQKDIGMDFICRLFLLLPQTKRVFGIQPHQDFSKDPRLMEKIKDCAMKIVESFDCILSSLGPDMDDLDEFLIEYAVILSKSNMTKLCVLESTTAVKETISTCFGNKWNDQYDSGWDELLTTLSDKMVELM